MKQFEIGKIYHTGKNVLFPTHEINYTCVRRTKKTVTFLDDLYNEETTKRIKTDSSGEYVIYKDAQFVDLEMRA